MNTLVIPVMDLPTRSNPAESLSKVMRAKLNLLLKTLLANCSDIRGAMVGSSDGIAWAYAFPNDRNFDAARFAAMSSALLALSDSIIREAQNGTIKNVLLENEGGNIFIMHAGNKLLLTVFAKPNVNLGMSLAHAKQTAEDIKRISRDAAR